MSKEIKTRQVHKDIKALDKSVTGVERVKRAYVRTKDQAEQTQPQAQEHGSPVGYAEDRISRSADTAVHETAHQVRKQGGRAVDTLKEKHRISQEKRTVKSAEGMERGTMPGKDTPASSVGKEDFSHQPKEQMKKLAQKRAEKNAVQKNASSQVRELPNQTIKTLDRGEKTIKTAEKAEKTVKTTGKGTIKYAAKTVKTSEQASHRAVKTSQQAMKAAHAAAKASAKTAKRTAAAARQAAKRSAQVVRATAKATAAAVRAIIAATKALITAIAAGGWIAILILIIVILFGGILCMVGGGNSSTVTPVSAEVEAYEPVIRKYANEYGIPEYVELIKAVMMQESGGRGLDPMQSSEGGFNTRYPRVPNGITDPEYSISCGVQELKDCLTRAGVENPVDMEHIKLALQGYNFGNGYISWAQSNYGGYTAANAAEFSDMMAQRMGWSGYGDKQYVPHVLRYYVFGRVPTGVGSQAIVQVALTQEGNVGGRTYWSWYGFESRVSWCACFVSWCADQCGYIDAGVIPKFSLCSDGVAWFQSKGQFMDGSYVPATGDIIFFDWGNDGSIDHVGIVESVVDGVVHTIEGNSGDACRRQSYSIGDSRIYGYGVPAY